MSTGRRLAAPRRGWALGLGLYLLGIFMGAIDTGIVTPARTIIADDLGVNQQLGIWMITVYTLAYAAAIPVLGKVADRVGRKPVYLTAIVLFGAGSLLCGLAQDAGSFWMLIAARVIQAIGGGGILPIATAEIGTEVPPERRGMALGLVGAVFGIANLLGASAGSLILDLAGPHNWQWIFYVNVPISALIVIAGVLVLPNHREASVTPLDLLGIALLVAMIMALLYGLTNLDFFDLAGSLQSVEVYPYLAGFVVLLPLFVLAERRAADPVLNLGYFTHRPVALTLTLSFLSGFVLMGVVFVPQLAENALELPSGSGGYLVILLGLASGVGAPLSGRLTDAWGAKRVLALGGGISLAAAVSAAAWLIPNPGYPSVIGTLVLIGLGLGFVIGSPLNYLMLQLTEPRQANSALGTMSLVRSIGTTVAPAIMVGFLAHAGAGMQDRLTAQLPSTIKAPELPYAASLQRDFARWKTDDRFAKALKGVEFPDLAAKSTINLDLTGGGELPADLVELLQNADVTTIVPVTETVARRMFAQHTPAVIADITSGVETGITQLGTVRHTLASTRADMTRKLRSMTTALAKMRTALVRMDRSVRKLDAAETSMTAGINRMGRAVTGLDKGIAGITKARVKQAKAIAGMTKGLAGLSRAIAGVRKAIAGIDRATAGIDAALAQQRAALAALQGSDDPAAQAQIAQLTR
ncbi:MAG: MFS transporter, partial [Micropruina sp.]|uniref:MFS transporter n=1 Tax=Micropruina sp. TaxID=2737536 RepID=UPI0039E64119